MKALVTVLVTALVFTLAGVAQAGEFGKSQQYMSDAGYARWQAYLRTGVWK